MSPDLEVLYCDNHLLAVNKPAGLLTQDSGTGGDNLENLAREWVRQAFSKPGAAFLHAVHRLDRPVSGIVLFARTSKALSRLNEQVRRRSGTKIYQALTLPGDLPTQGTLENWLIHGDRRAIAAEPEAPQAKQALLHYRILEKTSARMRWEISLVTGRYHQIRIQLSLAGFPILGDTLYGSREPWAQGAVALHHARMEIEHPTKKEPLVFEAPWHEAGKPA